MKIKLITHVMPHEIDYLMLNFIKLNNSKYYMSNEFELEIDVVLNLSSYLIDWKNSPMPRKYFRDKFFDLRKLISWIKINRYDVYDGNELYGHINLQKESISNDVDGYIYMCPDINFSETLLPYMCESAKIITDKYFVLTPQIYKMWDYTWDIITNNNYMHISYNDWDKKDSFELLKEVSDLTPEISKIHKLKFAGWFDYYSKEFVNTLFKIPEEWNGYAPWDFYCLLVSDYIQKNNIPLKVNQYVLENMLIHSYENKLTNDGGFKKYYKDNITYKQIPNQREIVESKMGYYISKWVEFYNNGDIK